MFLHYWSIISPSCIDIGDIPETIHTKELYEDFSIVAYITIMSLVTNIIQSFNPTYVHSFFSPAHSVRTGQAIVTVHGTGC